MQTVNIKINSEKEKSYDILIGKNTKYQIKDVILSLPSKKAIVVTNETIFGLYQDTLKIMFKDVPLDLEYCIIPDGEKYKNKDYLHKILTCAFEKRLERNDSFIAFGGGVIGDITGFAAAIYMRGINFIQIPTTILAQVDSSIGGKVAIDNDYGKNLLGAFYQPNAVITDLNFLQTLPKREILSGLSEVIKYAFIEKTCGNGFSDFARFLSDNYNNILDLNTEHLEQVVKRSCELKASVVNQDEKEQGLRAILNFGHTIGHAIEKCTDYKIFTHGEAISIGMSAVLKISNSLKYIDNAYFEFANNILNLYNLKFKIPKSIPIESILDALYYDKKVKDNKIRFVLPVGYSEVKIFDDIPQDLIYGVITELY